MSTPITKDEADEITEYLSGLTYKKGSFQSFVWMLYKVHSFHKKRGLSCLYQTKLGEDL